MQALRLPAEVPPSNLVTDKIVLTSASGKAPRVFST